MSAKGERLATDTHDWKPSCTRDFAVARNSALARLRQHFLETSALEVQCPALSWQRNPEPHFQPFRTSGMELQTSPEIHLKRLLAAGWGDVWTKASCYRGGEESPLHNLEFSMLEWYRCNISLEVLAHETLEVCRTLLAGSDAEIGSCQTTTYNALFLRETGFDWRNLGAISDYALQQDLWVGASSADH